MAELKWDNNLVNLRDILADLYRTQNDSSRVVQEAGLRPAFIDMEGSSIIRWHNILNHARQDKSSVDAIIDVAIGEQPPAVVLDQRLHLASKIGRRIRHRNERGGGEKHEMETRTRHGELPVAKNRPAASPDVTPLENSR